MKHTLLSLLAVGTLLLGGCTHSIHMVNINGFESKMPAASNANYVEASAEQEVILFFAYDSNYVDEAKQKLEQQCKGDLAAVSTQYSTSHGFLSWTNKILMKGICVN